MHFQKWFTSVGSKVVLPLAGSIACLATVRTLADTVLFSDNFDRATLNGGTTVYTVVNGGADGGASIVNNNLVLTNDATGNTTGNTSGRTVVTTDTSAFTASGFNQVLSSNTGLLTWTYDFRNTRADPSGFGTNNYGSAFILGATGGDLTAASGYAIVLGGSGTDPFRLVSFSGSLTSQTNIITSGATPFSDAGGAAFNHSWAFKVTYNPTNNLWSFFGRDDGTGGFTDPTAGTYVSLGSAQNSTFTGSTLTALGAAWNYATTSNQNVYDNWQLSLGAAIPPSQTLTWNVSGGAWNKTATNWTGGTGIFADGDTVNFTDAKVGAVPVDAAGVAPGAINVSNTTGNYAFSGGSISGAAMLTKTGAGTLTLSSPNGYSAGTAFNGGTVIADGGDDRLGAASGGLTFAGGTLKTATVGITSTRTMTITAAGGGGTFDTNTFNSSIAGAATINDVFNKSGAGDLTLSNTVAIGTAGKINILGGSLTLGQASGTITQANGGQYDGDLIITGAPRLNFAGAFTGSGKIRVAATNASIAITAPTSAAVSGTINQDIVLNPNNATPFVTNIGAPGASGGGSTPANTLTINGVISGAADVSFSTTSSGGAGILVLAKQNTYTGHSYLRVAASGVVRLGIADAIPTGTQLTFGTSAQNVGTLDLAGFNQTLAALDSQTSGTVQGITNTGTALSTFTITGSLTGTFAGKIGVVTDDATNPRLTGQNDNIALTLSAAHTGTLTLTGVNTYTGGTTIAGGTLLVGDLVNAVAAGSIVGSTSVKTGGKLGGLGTVGAVSLEAGSTLTPGTTNSTIGTLTATGLTWAPGATMKFDLSTTDNTADKFSLGAGVLSKGTNGTFLFDFGGTGMGGATYSLLSFGSLDLTLGHTFVQEDFSYANLAAGLTGTFNLSASELSFVVVPEPGSAGLAAFGGLALLGSFRRRKSAQRS